MTAKRTLPAVSANLKDASRRDADRAPGRDPRATRAITVFWTFLYVLSQVARGHQHKPNTEVL